MYTTSLDAYNLLEAYDFLDAYNFLDARVLEDGYRPSPGHTFLAYPPRNLRSGGATSNPP